METTPSRLPIENCGSWFRFRCPKHWSQLKRTGDLDVRYCVTCRQNVYYCDTLEAIEEHRQAGDCICIQVGVENDYAEWLGQ